MDEPGAEARPPAPWSSRVGAWLIDLLLVGAVGAVLGDLSGFGTGLVMVGNPFAIGGHGVLLFLYWTLFESRTGQSPGKLVLDLEVVDEDGGPPSLLAAAIESFGKAFLLPLDVLVGVIVMPGQGRRLFNRLSGTRVVVDDAQGPRNRGPSAVKA